MPNRSRTETISPRALLAPARGEALTPGSLLGRRYEIRAVLGSGGYAVVYRAFDRELKLDVALKILRPDRLTNSALIRLRREVKVAREARDTHLIRIFDIGSAGCLTYLSMELIEGRTLEERLREGPLGVDQAIAVAGQLLEALAALHRLGIVHRDVKPANVLLSETGEVKLADFGLALHLERAGTRATETDRLIGTLDYLSPEQILGRDMDPRADLYSVGLVLYESLTGRLPGTAGSAVGVLLSRVRTSAPGVRRLRKDVPRWLERVVRRLLEREPGDRYPSSRAVQRALEARRSWSWLLPRARRRRFQLAAALVVAACAVAILAATFLPFRSNERFLQLVPTSTDGIRAVDRQGKTMWTLSGIDPEVGKGSLYTLARIAPHEPKRLVTVLWPPAKLSPEKVQTLSILAADTGRTLQTVDLPVHQQHFSGYSDFYRPDQLTAVDLDHDGVDEILITYIHVPYAPSFTVLYEPKMNRARILFAAAGHHRFAGARDLTGDGRPEILFFGINNDLGWYNAAAVVRVVPWIGEPKLAHGSFSTRSPTMLEVPESRRNLLWYALLPRGRPVWGTRGLVVDPGSHALKFEYQDGSEALVDEDGFPLSSPSPEAPARRRTSRSTAYAHLREARRLLAAGDARQATKEAEAGAAAAREASLPLLTQALEVLRGRALVATGRYDEGQETFDQLARSSDDASDISYQAAEAFHRAGRLDRALRWYRRGLGKGASADGGRMKEDFLRGALFALVELHRWDDALQWIERYQDAYAALEQNVAPDRKFAQWMRGETNLSPQEPLRYYVNDFRRYWNLELERLSGTEAPETLRRKVEADFERASFTRPLLLSLEAELLADEGKDRQALAMARKAVDLTHQEEMTNVGVRAHAEMVEERLRRLEVAAGAEVGETRRSSFSD